MQFGMKRVMKSVWLGAVVALVVWGNRAVSQEITPIVEDAGVVLVEKGTYIHGNNVTQRSAYLPSGARKSWMDFEHYLPPGTLEKFFFYVHNFTNGRLTQVRPQIWRPTTVDDIHKLVWQRIVNVTLNHRLGALFTLDLAPEDRFTVQLGDRIGWANKDDFGPVTFDYVEGHKTYFTKAGSAPVEVGLEFEFDDIHLPSIFSVAVEINPSEGEQPLPTTSRESITTTSTATMSASTTDSLRTSDSWPSVSGSNTSPTTEHPLTSDVGLVVGIAVLAAVTVLMGIVLTVLLIRRKKTKPNVAAESPYIIQEDGYTALNGRRLPTDRSAIATATGAVYSEIDPSAMNTEPSEVLPSGMTPVPCVVTARSIDEYITTHRPVQNHDYANEQ